MPIVSSKGADHTITDPPRCQGKVAAARKALPGCPCGITEEHEHCSICGRLVSVGPGTVIAEYRLKLK